MSSQTSFNQLERDYYIRKGGASVATEPLESIKRKYFIGQVGTVSAIEALESLEKRWLQKIVSTAGDTPRQTFSELWKQAVSSVGGTPATMLTQNKRTFFSLAP